MQQQPQIPAFESGAVVLSTGNLEVMKVNLTSKNIDVDVENKEFIKRIISMRSQLIPQNPAAQDSSEPPKTPSPLAILRNVAEALKSRGITLTVSYQNHPIVTIGAQAKPTILQHITKTRAVAINSLYRAIRMVL